MSTEVSFSQWLKERRKSLDLTQEELARQVGCSLETIQKIEGGSRRPSKQLAELLATSLHVDSHARADFLRFARGDYVVAPPATTTTDKTQRPNNLHTPLTSIIGRHEEDAAVRDYLLNEGTRLLTLTGPPGIGKTRLSIEVATGMLPYFSDGVFFVPLASTSDPGLVATAISETLGVREVSGQPLLAKLVEFLRSKQLLLVLDNFEQVIAAGPVVADILKKCPGVKTLVTSRETLRLLGEQQFQVPPLGLAGPNESLSLEELSGYPAVALFVERARAVEPKFALTEENVAAVNAICTQLDGLPLAIELVAARIRVLPPQALLLKLSNRLELVRGRSQNIHRRHQSLRAAIDWSHDLLDPGEQTLFRRLGIFVGGCTLTSVEAVCNATGDLNIDTIDGLASLLDKSLLCEAKTADSEARFTMLETIREYAKERHEKSGETAILQRLHAEYYLALSEGVDPLLAWGEPEYHLDLLEREHDNLRAALAWSLEQGEAPILVRLSSTLWFFWYARRYFGEGRRWLEAALSLGAEVQGSIPQNAWAKALLGAGVLAYYQGDHTRAMELEEQSLMLYRELGEKWGTALALNSLGNLARDLGDYNRAESYFAESLALRKELGVPADTVLNNLGLVAYDMGKWERAEQFFSESLRLRRKLGKRSDIAFSIHCLGEVARQLGDTERATSFYEESLAFFNEIDDKRSIAMNLHGLGMLALVKGELEGAASLIKKSLLLRRELGERRLFVWDLEGLAATAGVAGQAKRASRLLGAAKALREAVGLASPPADLTLCGLTIRRIRALLGEEAFQQSWAEGEQMTMEHAIAYALEDVDQHGTSPAMTKEQSTILAK